MTDDWVGLLGEFRLRLIYSICVFLITFIVLFHFDNYLYLKFALPLLKNLLTVSVYQPSLVATDVLSVFFAPMKAAMFVAFLITLPFILYQIYLYIVPALHAHERILVGCLLTLSMILFILGILFCYFVTLPILFHFIKYIQDPNITILADIDKYLALVLHLLLIFGLVFELPIIIYLLVRFNIVKLSILVKYRKYMFVLAFIVAAILAPPDVLSQLLLALPLYLLYECGLFISRF